jgi:regulator of protease activity HflC (stomatin/prohibitin superfamily)
MLLVTISAIVFIVCLTSSLILFRQVRTKTVAEDHVAVTVNKNGFIKRVLPQGRHFLHPFERIDFTLETRTRLAANRAAAIATSDGILAQVNWSGIYALQPDLITDPASRSQRLRALPNAEKTISRQIDIHLRKLVGDYSLRDLFNPTRRERLERQLNQALADHLKPMGIVFKGLNLQAIELPNEVAEALNKAKAIETLDGAIRQLDPTTREVVRGVYQLDEILHWDHYLPTPTRMRLKKLEAMAQSN